MTKYKIIKDYDGNLLYKKKISDHEWYDDEEYRFLRKRQVDAQRNRDESLVGEWEHPSSINILRRIDRNFSPYSQYRKQYRCNYCSFTDSYSRTIREHLIIVHGIDDDSGETSSKQCHACKEKYNKLYKEEKYIDWNEYKRRKHHWGVCSKVQERAATYITVEASTWTENIFDTATLPINIRHELLNKFEKSYISNKHVYSECQPRYIDNVTTAYLSDVVKGILSHEN